MYVFCLYRFVEWEDFADHAMVHNPKVIDITDIINFVVLFT